ncbi:MAG: hypothetical protein RLZZ422_2145 [Pseudomonadota bacterium]|jgi:hypothetical protein
MSQALAWLLTLLLEVPLVVFFANKWGISWQRAAIVGIVASSITHPLAWKSFWAATVIWQTDHAWLWLVCIESLVWLIEAGVYRIALPLDWGRSMMLALLTNALSASMGMLIMWL